MTFTEQLTETLRTQGGVVLGGCMALAGTILGALITFLSKFFEHQWTIKRERLAEKKRSVDRLVAATQTCFRACTRYRGELIRELVNREKPRPARSKEFADEAGRIALLSVPECASAVENLRIAEHAFVIWVAGLAEELLSHQRDPSSILTANSDQQFKDHLQPLVDASEEIYDRCSKIAAKL